MCSVDPHCARPVHCKGMCQLHYLRAWQSANRDKTRLYNRRCYEKNSEVVCRRTSVYQKENKDKINKRLASPLHREKKRAREKKRYQDDPGAAKARCSRRRVLLKGGGGGHTAEDRKALFEAFAHKCPACGSTERLEVDHIIPVSRGGTDDPWNLQILCRPCNRKKGAQSFFVAYPRETAPCD